MEKKEILDKLRHAKSAHIKWRAYAHALVHGLPVEKEHVPVIHTDCVFGKWFHGPGQCLSHLRPFQTIDRSHEMLHQIYMNIFKLLFVETEDERSTLQKLFGSKSKIKKDKKEKSKILLEELLSISGTLLDAISLLENEIRNMPQHELSNIY